MLAYDLIELCDLSLPFLGDETKVESILIGH
jgi:hypothetical protein